MCRQSDLEGPVSPLDSSVARCPVPDGLRVSLQRGIRGSCVGGSGQRRTMRGVGEMIWRVADKLDHVVAGEECFSHHHIIPVLLKFVERDPP